VVAGELAVAVGQSLRAVMPTVLRWLKAHGETESARQNKPVILKDGSWLSASSTEGTPTGWRAHFELSRDRGRTWQFIGPIDKGPSGLEAMVSGIRSCTCGCRAPIGRSKTSWEALPIWVGIFEANAIALELEKVTTPRPMTHELFGQVLETLQTEVLQAVINDEREQVYFGRLILRQNEHTYDVDSRPSDAVALAVQKGAPIFVEEAVLAKASKAY
jgi:bifunctional DNase/RNase